MPQNYNIGGVLMKRFIPLLLVIVLSITALSTSLGVLAGKELGGRERLYVGASLMLGDVFGLGLDVYYPISSFETAGEELSRAQLIEADPGLFLSLSMDNVKLYGFVGPMVIFDLQTYDYQMLPLSTLRGKAGIKIKLGGLSLFAEGLTSFTYSPEFATSGIYAVHGGISLGF
jgi:hypothetical protein